MVVVLLAGEPAGQERHRRNHPEGDHCEEVADDVACVVLHGYLLEGECAVCGLLLLQRVDQVSARRDYRHLKRYQSEQRAEPERFGTGRRLDQEAGYGSEDPGDDKQKEFHGDSPERGIGVDCKPRLWSFW